MSKEGDKSATFLLKEMFNPKQASEQKSIVTLGNVVPILTYGSQAVYYNSSVLKIIEKCNREQCLGYMVTILHMNKIENN